MENNSNINYNRCSTTSWISDAINNCWCTTGGTKPINSIRVTLNGLCDYAKEVVFDFENNKLVCANKRFIIDNNAAKLYLRPTTVTEFIKYPISTEEPHYIIYGPYAYALLLIDESAFTGINLATGEQETFYFTPDEDGICYINEICSADEEIQKAGFRITPEKYAKLKEEAFNK